MGRNKHTQQIYETACMDCAEMMTELIVKYKSYPGIIATTMADSLGAFTALTADSPQKALDSIAERIKNTDINKVRLKHFGWKLGVKPEVEDDDDGRTGEENGERDAETGAGSAGDLPEPPRIGTAKPR